MFDGRDINTLDVQKVRCNLGLVEQEPDLFGTRSIKENIAYGDNTRYLEHEEVVQAATAANIHEEIAVFKKVLGFSNFLLSG